MTLAEKRAQLSIQRRLASGLILEAKRKEYEAACWMGLQNNIEQARAAIHSAIDADIDAVQENIRAAKDQFGHSS